jgi:hypothetical protein
MTMSKLMEIIIQQSWRDILLTALLAASILYYYSGNFISSTNETQVASSEEEERRRRRDHLAKIAEGRAKRIACAAAAAPVAVATSGKEGRSVTIQEVTNNKVLVRKKNSNKRYNGSSAKSNASTTVSILLPKETAAKMTLESNQIEKKTPPIQKKKMTDAINNGDSTTASNNNEANSNKAVSLPKNKENDSKVERNHADKDKSKVLEDSSMRQIINDGNSSEKTVSNANVFNDDAVSNHERGVAATTKTTTTTTSNTKVAQENDRKSITIYLLKSETPRIEITIPKNTTPSQLRQIAADSTDIPLTGLRLIFRGRMIVETKSTDKRSVIKEFGIEEGSTLHVVGKPRTTTSAASSSSSTASPSQQQQQQQQQTSPSQQQQDMSRLIHQGLADNPNFFHYAAAAGNYELIEAAIHDGTFNTYLNRADENDWTPLHEAIRGGHQHLVTLLLDEGGLDMHAITNQGGGYSPLSLSISYHGDHHPLTGLLRDRGGREVWPDEGEHDDSESSSSNDEEETKEEVNPWRNS